MYAVIFKAKINKLDKSYDKMPKQMQELAINKYGCIEFVSATQDTDEITISYWQNQEGYTTLQTRYTTPGRSEIRPFYLV